MSTSCRSVWSVRSAWRLINWTEDTRGQGTHCPGPASPPRCPSWAAGSHAMKHYRTSTRRRAHPRHGVLCGTATKLANADIPGVPRRVLDRAVFRYTVKRERNIKARKDLSVFKSQGRGQRFHMISVNLSSRPHRTSQLDNRLLLNSLSASGANGGFSWAG